MRGKWIVKAVLQKGMSFLPDPQRANYFFQDKVSHSTTLTPSFFKMHVDFAAEHLNALRRLQPPKGPFHALELGSGWFPIVPLTLFLAGAETVTMVDLEDLSRPELVRQAVDAMIEAVETGGLDGIDGIDPARVERLRGVRSLIDSDGHAAALASVGIRIQPGDARDLVLVDAPDLICSNTVLEHISADVLVGVLARFATIAKPGTVMSHLVDHCDHYAYIDDRISVYHFLRYSDRAWKLIDNDLQPMNRLRASEYRAIYERAGVEITEEHLFGDDPLQLVGEPLAPRFKAMDPTDVATKASTLVTHFS